MIPRRRLVVVNERHRHCLRPSSARPTGGFLCQRSCLSILSAGARGRDISITSLRHSDRGRGNLETAAPANGQFTLAPGGEGRGRRDRYAPGNIMHACTCCSAGLGGGEGGGMLLRDARPGNARAAAEIRDAGHASPFVCRSRNENAESRGMTLK